MCEVHNDYVPNLVSIFHVGWVPHRVNAGESGGDVIKTYEYRAGLPVLRTPATGASSRGLNQVEVLEATPHSKWLRHMLRHVGRVSREIETIPAEMTLASREEAELDGKSAAMEAATRARWTDGCNVA